MLRHSEMGTTVNGSGILRSFTVACACVVTALTVSACNETSGLSSVSQSGNGGSSSSLGSGNSLSSLDPEESETPSEVVVTSTVEAPTPTTPGVIDPPLVEDLLQTAWSSLEDPHAELDLSELLTGTALEDFENQRMEWTISEFHQEGKAEIISTDIEPATDSDQVTATVCVDSSAVKVLDENGTVVNDGIPPEELRSTMIVILVREENVWRIVERQFPDDPRC